MRRIVSSRALGRGVAWLLAAIPLLGVLELGAHALLVRSAPHAADYAALTAPVEDFKREGEPLLVAPRWAAPWVRAALSDERLPLEEQAPASFARFASTLEVSVAGHRDPRLGHWTVAETKQVGPFELRRLVNPAPPPADAVDLVSVLDASTEVFVRPRVTLPGQKSGDQQVDCRWTDRARVRSGGLGGHPTLPRERFQCPGGHYYSVGVTVIADQDYRPRRCIWAHPPARGELVVRFPRQRLGRRIVGHSGIEWMMERAGGGAPVELRVRLGDELLAHVVHVDGDGWAPFDVDLGDHAGTDGALEFSVSSPNHQHRHFCFEASMQ
jgi:hypothetical protein